MMSIRSSSENSGPVHADVDEGPDHQLVDEPQRAAHHFRVPAGDGIERARINAGAIHGHGPPL
jgi:hypothetical protein